MTMNKKLHSRRDVGRIDRMEDVCKIRGKQP